MKTAEIYNDIMSNGGFDNFRNWNRSEKAEWVKAAYNCSTYVAKQVSYLI